MSTSMKRFRKALSRPVHPWVAAGSLFALFLAVVLGVPSIALLQTTSYTNAQLDARFVNTTGDYIPGKLKVEELCFTGLNPADERCKEGWDESSSGSDSATGGMTQSAADSRYLNANNSKELFTGEFQVSGKATIDGDVVAKRFCIGSSCASAWPTGHLTQSAADGRYIKKEGDTSVSGYISIASNGYAIRASGKTGGIWAEDTNSKGYDNKTLRTDIAMETNGGFYGVKTNGMIEANGDIVSNSQGKFNGVFASGNIVTPGYFRLQHAKAADVWLEPLPGYPTWGAVMFGETPGEKSPNLSSDGKDMDVAANRSTGGTLSLLAGKEINLYPNGKKRFSFTDKDAFSPAGGSFKALSSDGRLKNVDGAFTAGLDAIRKLNPIWYYFKPGNVLGLPSAERMLGFIAQDVQKALPEAVTPSPLDSNYLTIDPNPIMWAMLNSIKELDTKNQTLEKKNKSLEQDLKELRQDVEDLRMIVEQGR